MKFGKIVGKKRNPSFVDVFLSTEEIFLGGLQEKRNSPASMKAIRTWMIEEIDVLFEVKKEEKKSIDKKEKPTNLILEIDEWYSKREKLQMKAIVFIDGDNASNSLDDLNKISPNICERMEVGKLETKFGILKDWNNSKMLLFEKRSWLPKLSSLTNLKEAVDHSLNMVMLLVHLKLIHNLNIPFFSGSTRPICWRSSARIQSFGRQCKIINWRNTSLHSELLKNVDIPYSKISKN